MGSWKQQNWSHVFHHHQSYHHDQCHHESSNCNDIIINRPYTLMKEISVLYEHFEMLPNMNIITLTTSISIITLLFNISWSQAIMEGSLCEAASFLFSGQHVSFSRNIRLEGSFSSWSSRLSTILDHNQIPKGNSKKWLFSYLCAVARVWG